MTRPSPWTAGIAWTREGYEVSCLRADGTESAPARFAADDLPGLVGHVRAVCGAEEVVAVIDSTNGLLDGPLHQHGLRVRRADPWHLPARPVGGSVPAAVLARAPGDGPVETDVASGALKGRDRDMAAAQHGSTAVAAELARQGRYLEHGPRDLRRVALTFDDGPTPAHTERILDVLRHYGVPATFFCVGLHARTAPETLARIAREGHGIGNHTWSHPFLPDLSREELLFQLDETDRAVAAVTGERPRLVRPPYGSQTDRCLEWIAEGDRTTVLWDTDPQDWAQPGAAAITANALAGITAGSVVLMHDGGGDRSQTVTALPGLVEALLAADYRLVTVAEMGA